MKKSNKLIIQVATIASAVCLGIIAMLGTYAMYANSKYYDDRSAVAHLEYRLTCKLLPRDKCASCDDFPSKEKAMRIEREYADEIQAIEDIDEGKIDMGVVTDFIPDCHDSARFNIYYATEDDKRRIMDMLDDDLTFHGIPVAFWNI